MQRSLVGEIQRKSLGTCSSFSIRRDFCLLNSAWPRLGVHSRQLAQLSRLMVWDRQTEALKDPLVRSESKSFV